MTDKSIRTEFKISLKDIIFLIILLIVGYYAYDMYSKYSSINKENSILASVLVALVVFVVVVLYSAKHVKSHTGALILGLILAVTAFIILDYKNIINLPSELAKDIEGISVPNPFSHKPTKEQILKVLHSQYADPAKNEVYWPGNKNIQNYANAAHLNLSIWTFETQDFVCYVETDKIARIQEELDSPQDVWNNIFYGHIYPIMVYVPLPDGTTKPYVVYCRCHIKTANFVLSSTVHCPSGRTYDLNNEYRHMNRNDAIYCFNNPPAPWSIS